MTFEELLSFGKTGEDKVSDYLILCGWTTFPICESPTIGGKGPRLDSAGGKLIAPDILAFTHNQSIWFEVKTKRRATQYRKKNKHGMNNQWQTGIDINVFNHYQEVANQTPLPVRLLFLHLEGRDNYSGDICPTGLYYQTIEFLKEYYDHKDTDKKSYGKDGMIYWNMSELQKIATLEEIDNKIPKILSFPDKQRDVIIKQTNTNLFSF